MPNASDVSSPSGALDSVSFKVPWIPRILRGREQEGSTGKLWEVRLIEAGRSLNGLNYAATVLQEAVPLFEGLPVFSYVLGDKQRHAPEFAVAAKPAGFSGNRVGQVVETWWTEEDQAIDGLVAIDDEDTRTRLLNSYKRGAIGSGDGEQDVEAFSINAEGLRRGEDVVRIVRGGSLDLVTRPAAGGRFKRLVAAIEDDDENTDAVELGGSDHKPTKEEGMPEATQAAAETNAVPQKIEEADPVSQLRFLADKLQGAAGKARADVLQQMRAIIGRLAGDEKPPAYPSAYPFPKKDGGGEDRFAKAAAALSDIESHESIREDADLRGRIRKALALLKGETIKEDERDSLIASLEARLRESAIGREMDKLVPELRILDPDAAARLVDLEKVRVSEDYRKVSGLKESLARLVEARPWLIKPEEKVELVEAKTDEKTGTTDATATDATTDSKNDEKKDDKDEKKKPEPRGQAVALRESLESDTTPADIIAARMRSLVPFILQGDARAAAEHEKLRLGLGLGK